LARRGGGSSQAGAANNCGPVFVEIGLGDLQDGIEIVVRRDRIF
jgi:hypothetical protein